VGALLVKHDASRILMPFWIHCGILCTWTQKVACGMRRWKFTFPLFKSGKM
jgi:hypothetical protein